MFCQNSSKKRKKKNISESKNPKGICQIMKRLSARSIHSYFKRGFVKNCNVTFSAELKYTEKWIRNPWTHKIVQLSLNSRFTNYKLVENKNKTRNNNPLIFPDSQLEALRFVLGLWRPRRYTLNPGGRGRGYSTNIWRQVSCWGFKEPWLCLRQSKIAKHTPCLGQHPQCYYLV